VRTATATFATAAVLAVLAALAPGCKGKKAADPEPASPTFKPLAGSGRPRPNVLDLPRSSHSGPVKTTQPLAQAQYEKMSGLEVPGWVKTIRYLNEKALEVRYKTEARPVLSVTITASPCFDCIPPDLPRWKAKEDALKNLLLPELRERRDTVFEIGEDKLADTPMIFTYQLAHGYVEDEDKNRQGPYSNAYTVYHNDGINQIRVIAQYADDPVATREQLVDLAPRDDLRRIALAFLDAYTHAW
jgi:hypothetical protein